MFDFIKKWFQEEEVLSEEEIKVDGLSEWLSDKLVKLDFKEEMMEFLNQVKDKKWVLGEKIEALEAAEIDEKEKDRVDEKIKNIVLGHRDNYVREMRRFLERLGKGVEGGLIETIEFNVFLNKELDILAERTAKSYQAAQHLFFKPVEEVFKTVGEVNILVKAFDKKLEKKGFDNLGKLRKIITFLQEEKKKREKLEEDIKWKGIKLLRCEEGKEKQEEEINQLKSSEEYDELQNLKEQKEELEREVKDNNDEIFSFFSELSRALRKYEKVTLEIKVVQGYLEDPVKMFFEDKKLKILGVLEGLKRSMDKAEVNLDEKQKDKVFEVTGKVSYLKKLQEKGEELQKKKEGLKAKLRRYNVDRLIEEAEYKREHFEDQIVLVKREIEELKVKLQALGEDKLKEDVVNLVKEVLKVELKIV